MRPCGAAFAISWEAVMRTFREGVDALPRELQLKLANRFLAFCEAREAIRRRMESYVNYQIGRASCRERV